MKADPGLLGEDVMVKSEPVDLQEFYASQLQVVLVIVFERFRSFLEKKSINFQDFKTVFC